jgi:hypothetical protein
LIAEKLAAGKLRRLAVPNSSIERKAGLILRRDVAERQAVRFALEEIRLACDARGR